MISSFIEHYGYFALFAGTVAEGETVLITAGFAVHRGWLDFPWVIAVAALGGFCGDMLAFALGRWQGQRLISRFPALGRQVPRIEALLARYRAPVIIGIRFMYGLRIAGPAILGASQLPVLEFALYNAVGALLWATLFATLGLIAGDALALLLGDLEKIEGLLAILILVAGLAILLWRRQRRAR